MVAEWVSQTPLRCFLMLESAGWVSGLPLLSMLSFPHLTLLAPGIDLLVLSFGHFPPGTLIHEHSCSDFQPGPSTPPQNSYVLQ